MTHRATCALLVSLLHCATAVAGADAVDIAAGLIGRPYVWGAEGPDAFDCSGLTQYVYGEIGIELPRRAISQSRSGEPADRRLQRGDLVFFSSDAAGSVVTHVGIYEGAGLMIDASKRHGRVRRDSISDAYWSERFMFARRIGAIGSAPELPVPVRRPQIRRANGRETAVRILGHLAEVLIRRRIR